VGRALVRASACCLGGCRSLPCCTYVGGLEGEAGAELSARGRLDHEPLSLPIAAEIAVSVRLHWNSDLSYIRKTSGGWAAPVKAVLDIIL